MGPKKRAMLVVPLAWTMNRATRMPAEIGTTKASIRWPIPGASLRPSIAESTETAGVMMPSP